MQKDERDGVGFKVYSENGVGRILDCFYHMLFNQEMIVRSIYRIPYPVVARTNADGLKETIHYTAGFERSIYKAPDSSISVKGFFDPNEAGIRIEMEEAPPYLDNLVGILRVNIDNCKHFGVASLQSWIETAENIHDFAKILLEENTSG